MSHEPKVVAAKQLSNGLVAYRVVCCGAVCDVGERGTRCSPAAHVCEDTWHTMAVEGVDHEARLKIIFSQVARRHEAMVSWRGKYVK